MKNDPREIPLEALDTEIFTTLNNAEAESLLGGTRTQNPNTTPSPSESDMDEDVY